MKENTHDRLRAFSDRQSYDEAVNELLDQVEFATVEELNAEYRPVEQGRI